jgi:hypothetical protein
VRFSIKDMLWLTLVVALAVGWRIHYESMRQFISDAEYSIEKWVLERRVLRDELNKLYMYKYTESFRHKHEWMNREWRLNERLLVAFQKLEAENESLKADLEAQRDLLNNN